MPRARIVVKIQRSVAGNRGDRMLIYSRDQSIYFEGETSSEIAQYLAGADKLFAFAALKADGQLDIGERAPWQDW